MTDVPRERIVVDVEQVFRVNQRKGKRCDLMLLYVERYPARRPQHPIKAKILDNT